MAEFSSELIDFAYSNLPFAPVTTLRLPNYTYVGSYTMEYVTVTGDVLCGDCATEALLEELEGFYYVEPIVAFGVIEESEYDERCAGCNDLLCEGYRDDSEES